MKNVEEYVTKRYISDYNSLVKRVRWRVPHQSLALSEECVQEAFSNALQYSSTYDNTRDIDKWFNTILNNVVKKCKRDESNAGVSWEDNDFEEIPVKESPLEKHIIELIHKTPHEESKILKMFFILGFTSREISEFFGKNHNTVRQTIARFRMKTQNEIIST